MGDMCRDDKAGLTVYMLCDKIMRNYLRSTENTVSQSAVGACAQGTRLFGGERQRVVLKVRGWRHWLLFGHRSDLLSLAG
jgi:hypothetical protein